MDLKEAFEEIGQTLEGQGGAQHANGALNETRLPSSKLDTDSNESDEAANSKRGSDAVKDPTVRSPNISPSNKYLNCVEQLDDELQHSLTTTPDSPTRLSRYKLIKDAATMVVQARERDLSPAVRQHIKEFGLTAIRNAGQLDAEEIEILSEATQVIKQLSSLK